MGSAGPAASTTKSLFTRARGSDIEAPTRRSARAVSASGSGLRARTR
ncbi:MAG: hypothetical protein MZW92_63740 [Comamonadaceae bacterium]|nr:hypothetical protein [Comamonadaceae bacterium]